MTTYTSIYNFKTDKKSIVTLGTFDGVHIGHQKILQKVLNSTCNNNYNSVVLTFFPHPRMVLNQQSDIKLLHTLTEKQQVLEQFGIDSLIVHPFDEAFANLSAEEFVKNILVDIFKTQKIIIGYDHRFGKNRSADITVLKEFGIKYGFEVEEISAQEINEVSVSSTKIRTALTEGNIEKANQYLGHAYTLSGSVQRGRGIGKTINFATANLKINEPYKLIPKDGVYVVSAIIDNKQVMGMMNIGYNPTVEGKTQSIEVHFLNFNQNLYDASLQIFLHKRIRNELKFNNLEALKNQLEKDKQTTLEYFKTEGNKL